MKAKLEQINSISQAIVVEVTAELVEKSRQKVLSRLAKEIKIPGFRKGKVPAAVVEKQLGDNLQHEVLEQVVRDSYPDALREVEARPISDPKIEPAILTKGEGLSYRATYEIVPELELKKYTGLHLEREPHEVTDEEMQQELRRLQERMTQLEPVEGEGLAEGMMGRINFKGTADGKPFKGSESKDFVVDIGSGHLLKEFEHELSGMKKGEKRNIHFVYPTDYFNQEVAGKKGAFEVQLTDLRRKVVPHLDDEFAKSLGSYETFEKLQEELKNRILEAKKNMTRRSLHRQVMEKLAEEHPIEVPQTMVQAELNGMIEQLHRDLQRQGKTLQDVGINAEHFVKENYHEALLRTRGFLVISAIGKKEGLQVTAEEITERIQTIAAASGQKESEVRAHFEQKGLISRLGSEIFLEKALDFVAGKSKIRDVDPKKEKKTKKSGKKS
ncbi:MAG: trigger factor [Deltaproteobacteria bacterium RIFCSPLOWO2_02_FULL_44_10]|nr:MAG: trigger factor [Deltaproteobacteria bacterium RIFCSPHIGHO2_02_FULL_44_16]OGQ45814.1 MAG: trigger factor [Deltaproteobacteria bacterium RIFCSPLOWO2_02_FULL_44_10]